MLNDEEFTSEGCSPFNTGTNGSYGFRGDRDVSSSIAVMILKNKHKGYKTAEESFLSDFRTVNHHRVVCSPFLYTLKLKDKAL